jgi:hypothetical protein
MAGLRHLTPLLSVFFKFGGIGLPVVNEPDVKTRTVIKEST